MSETNVAEEQQIRKGNCKCCGKEWIQDENGLVPEFCYREQRYYGYYVPKPLEERYNPVDDKLGCPECRDGNWHFVSKPKRKNQTA